MGEGEGVERLVNWLIGWAGGLNTDVCYATVQCAQETNTLE